jgi:hypothetical protein
MSLKHAERLERLKRHLAIYGQINRQEAMHILCVDKHEANILLAYLAATVPGIEAGMSKVAPPPKAPRRKAKARQKANRRRNRARRRGSL